MAFGPDLGIYLLEKGTKRETDLIFTSMLVPQLGTPDGVAFCSTCNTSFDGSEYALTVDMDRARLDELIMSCPGNTAQTIVDVLRERAGQGWSMRMDEQILVNVTGRLGEPPQSSRDKFVPLTALKIEPTFALAPISTVAALIALGREVGPFLNRDDPEAEGEIGALRLRVVAIGQKVDAAGGIKLM